MDKQQAQRIIKDTFENPFHKAKFTHFIKNLLNRIDESPFTYQGQLIPDAYKQYITSLERLGKFSDGENNLDILIVKLKKETSLERARFMQRNFVAWYLKGSRGGQFKDAALVAFVSPDEADWRFSLVKIDYKFEQTKSGKTKAKEEFTPARRWSFLVGENEKSHTAQSRLVKILQNDECSPTLEELEQAFDIESVSKEFFLKYRDLFIRTKEELDKLVKSSENLKADFEQKGVDTVNFAKKLLGQIIFLYFLQKKGWFGVGRDSEWGRGSKQFLRELFLKKHGDYKNFFNEILEPLFYEALRHDRSYDDGYYSRFDCKIPFLNGGLFDPIGNYDWVKTEINLPDSLFSNTKKTKEGDTGDGILDVFDRYNFTVREDEPLEKEVAIDPELLGKAYEKFNAIRPDNFEDYKKALKSGNKGEENKFNKKFGVYYTPREIVHYMCRQSLTNYLYTELNKDPASYEKLGDSQLKAFGNEDKTGQLDLTIEHKTKLEISKEDIEILIQTGEHISENEAIYLEKEQKIKNGEQKTTRIKPVLPGSIKNNYELIDEKLAEITVCDPAVGSGAFPVGMMSEIVKARNSLTPFIKNNERNSYNFKRHCIEKSLYGVDIDPGAVEISKLRLWLSLMVDEEDIKNIKPLPNLDYKIVCGNSLLGVEKNMFNEPLFAELETLKPLFFNETNPKKKKEYKNKIDELISEITNWHEEFDFEVYFSEVFHKKGGFDVVIANPPYVRQEKIKDYKPLLEKARYRIYNSTSDLYTYFYECSYNIIAPDRFSCFISSNKWMRAKYGEKLRKFLKENTKIFNLIDFAGYSVFEATVDTNILLFKKSKHDKNSNVKYINVESDFNDDNLIAYIENKQNTIPQTQLKDSCWTLADDRVLRLKEKIERVGIPLKNWNIKIYRGIITGFNEAFIINNETKQKLCKENPISKEIIKPILRGRDIKRYNCKWAGLWLIKIESGWTNANKHKKEPETFFKETYPAVYNHLKSKGDKKGKGKGLYLRDDQGDYWWELRDCVYYGEFEKEKIVYSDIADRLLFSYEDKRMFTNNTIYFLNTGNKYLLAVLNSLLLNFYYKQISSQLGKAAIRAFTIYIEQLPIPKVPEEKKNPFITLFEQILAITKDNNYLQSYQKQAKVKAFEREIEQMVYKLYGLTEEEIKIVEGGNASSI